MEELKQRRSIFKFGKSHHNHKHVGYHSVEENRSQVCFISYLPDNKMLKWSKLKASADNILSHYQMKKF